MIVKSIVDTKKWLSQSNSLHNHSNFNVFRFSKVEGEAVLDVKLLSTSLSWTRVGNITPDLPSLNELSMEKPEYKSIDEFEMNLDKMVQLSMMSDTGAIEWRNVITNLKESDTIPQWSFEDFPDL